MTRLCCIVAALIFTLSAAAERMPVDSGSIDEEELRLQRQGYADALVNPRILSAITSGTHQSIAIAYIEFAARGCTTIGVPWTRIHDKTTAAAVGAAILAIPRKFCPGGNAIGEAVNFASTSIAANEFDGARRVIDVSGDGPNTIAPAVETARDLAVASGITINGLVIDQPRFPELEAYFRRAISGGPGAFVIKAEDRRAFGDAILKKLIIEVAAGDRFDVTVAGSHSPGGSATPVLPPADSQSAVIGARAARSGD
jgi:Protein of unknown function (DUF1194)